MMILSNCDNNDQEPERTICVHTVQLKSDRDDTIGTDSNGPIQGIRISTVP